MNGYDLFKKLNETISNLETALNALSKRGREYAESEKNYRIALSKSMLLAHKNGVPATILTDICRGKEKIANLRFERDVKETLYKSSIEAINVYKLEINLLREQIDREWNNT